MEHEQVVRRKWLTREDTGITRRLLVFSSARDVSLGAGRVTCQPSFYWDFIFMQILGFYADFGPIVFGSGLGFRRKHQI